MGNGRKEVFIYSAYRSKTEKLPAIESMPDEKRIRVYSN
jgi:hypothetical protein